MLDIQAFLNCFRACLIAPAGYGKTHFIVDCMRVAPVKQLILTHTHAGVASLREKLAKEAIPPSRYTLCTISSLAKDLYSAYANNHDRTIPEDDKAFFCHAVRIATKIASTKNIQTVLRISFAGIFVDEYQDCNIEQHGFIMSLSNALPLRVLGDPMQSIFDFDNSISPVSFENDLRQFQRFCLDSPKRWLNTNPRLGEEIKDIRTLLETNRTTTIDYIRYSEIKNERGDTRHMLQFIYSKTFRGIATDSWLVIPSNSCPGARIKLAKQLGSSFRLLEAMDEQCFYRVAKQVDKLIENGSMLEFYNLCCSLFLKTSLDKWISASGPKSKRKPNERELMKPLNEALQAFNATKSPRMLMQVFFRLEKLPDITCYRFEIHESLIRAIHESVQTGLSVYESMKAERNRIRLAGRKNHHRSIGSTLLTKGQEFDHVIVVNQGKKFDLSTETGRKNFYVAISRACKSLTIIDVSE